MVIGPFRIVVAFGKTNSDVSNDTVNIAETTHDITAHPYSVAEHIFVSTSADASVQYLGPILSETVNSITTTFETNASKGATAKFWTPTTSVIFTLDTQRQFPVMWDSATRSGVTRGGAPFNINSGAGHEILTFQLDVGTAANATDFKTFLDGRNNGADFFSLAWYDYYTSTSKVDKVLWQGPTFSKAMQNGILNWVQYEMSFVIHTADTYVA